MSTYRAKLRDEISSKLIPLLKKSGFDGPEKISGNQLQHSYKRKVGKEIQLIIVQLEKYQKPRFVLNLEIYSDEDKLKGAAIVKAKPGSGLNCWFRADPSFWQKLLGSGKSREQEAVQKCIGLLPHVESWWKNQKETKNIVNSFIDN